MKAKVVKNFYDRTAKVNRKVGETFTVSAERFREINSTKYGVLAEEVKTAKAEKAQSGGVELASGEE